MADTSQYHDCPLCGFEFDRDSAGCDRGCAMSPMCRLIRCPSCGYEFSDKPESISWFRRIFQTKPKDDLYDLMPVTSMKPGSRAILKVMAHQQPARRNSLAVFGLVPGCELTVIQHKPTSVLRVGETELALEHDIARELMVQPVETVTACVSPTKAV